MRTQSIWENDYSNELGMHKRLKPVVRSNLHKHSHIETYLSYNDPDTSERTVFGVPADSPYGHKNLLYVYDDRLDCTKWRSSLEAANCVYSEPNTARFYEIGLSLYYGKPVNLQHIILGVNRSNGFSYLIFGFEK